DRTGVSTETGLLKEWPKDGPTLLWKATGLGSGYSTPSVYQGHLFVIGGKGGDESVYCLDVKDGKQVWSTRIGSTGRGGYPGPRCTPTVDDTLLYAISSDGDLACLETATGKAKWTKSYRKDFGGEAGKWSFAESPLVDGDVLICTPGGTQATMVA